MKITSRPYQLKCATEWYQDILTKGVSPVIAAPTGSGKSIILCLMLDMYLKDNPHNEVLVLSHTKEIVEQDFNAITRFLPEIPVAIHSAGLGLRDRAQITVAGIQSIYQKATMFAFTNLIVIDEAHAVSHKAEGMYRTFLSKMFGKVAGMSATVFRAGHGYIYKGETAMFNKLSHDLTSVDSFNQLIDDGWLSPLVAVKPSVQMDSSDVKKTAADFNLKALAAKHDKQSVTVAALKEAVVYGKRYKSWLVFAIDTDHADHIGEELEKLGVTNKVLHSNIEGDRDEIIKGFRKSEFRALVAVGMVTTGFDVPQIDLILMLRPTESPVLHVQMWGRGLRPYPGKSHCLALDYAGNFERLGPLNDVSIPGEKQSGGGDGEQRMKTCPECATLVPPATKTCPSCGTEFKFEVKIETTAGTSSPIVTKAASKKRWLDVRNVKYKLHHKAGKPTSIEVSYICGLKVVKDWWCLEHQGYPGTKAAHIVKQLGYKGPMKVRDVYTVVDTLAQPSQICVDFADKYPTVVNSRL